MKEKVARKMDEIPENPPWTMFFDGPLYQKYDEFMKTKDFSKILLNTKLRLANDKSQEVVNHVNSVVEDHWEKDHEADPTGNAYQYVSQDYFQRNKEDEKRRTRRTRAFIVIGFVIMAALAFGTALVIHYFFIPPLDERNPKTFVNVSFSVNSTASATTEITQTTPIDEHEDEMNRMFDELLKGANHHSHDHDHEHILYPDGKIFDEHFTTTTQEITSQKTTTQEITTQASTTQETTIDTIQMRDITSYTFENVKLNCSVKRAIKWKSLSVKNNKKWRPLEVTLFPSGEIKWSRRKTKRHDVTYDITNSTDGTGSNITIRLIINDVQCRDGNTYFCSLKSDIKDRVVKSQLTTVGKPSQKIMLTLGPSIIEDRAFRITASWQGGYPIPWANMSWTALDANNKSYNLTDYGEYRDYELHVDHKFCQTTLQHSIVVFPRIHLNDTTVIVKPNLETKKYFVDKSMETYLRQVQPGVEKILVIPLNYCNNGKKEMSVPHPHTSCTKFLRCLPGDLVVQQCPTGTCFYEKGQQCA